MINDSWWWTIRDIELELGRPVLEAPLLIKVREMRREVDDISRRMRSLATLVERLDVEAQEAIIERGEHPRDWWFDPELPFVETDVPVHRDTLA
jgi:hypothetical protein